MTKGHDLLRRFIANMNERPAKTKFAERSGLGKNELSFLLGSKRTANLRQAALIEDATNGAVPIRSWLQKKRKKNGTSKT